LKIYDNNKPNNNVYITNDEFYFGKTIEVVKVAFNAYISLIVDR